MNRVLLVDDDDAFVRVYSKLLEADGFQVAVAQDRPTAIAAFKEADFDVVLLDLMLPPDGSVSGGMDQLDEMLSLKPNAQIVVASGAGDQQFMIRAVRAGAFDFLTKPVDPDVLVIVLQRAIAHAKLQHERDSLRESLAQTAPAGAMIGQSPRFQTCLDMAARVAPSELPVLILGENGTGKELMARFVHDQSPRRGQKFVAVNCGALTETLLDSTLFGHVKGAFTGAVQDRDGLFVEADGGTLFLDEVGDMPPALQVKVLRALESGEVLAVGSDRPKHVDVRIVSATNRDLNELMDGGDFREDTYWRLNGASIELPPLRERTSDIPELADHFMNQSRSLAHDGLAKQLTDSALDALKSHPWPGNLREFRHVMQRATVMSGDSPTIGPEHLGLRPATTRSVGGTLADQVDALEHRLVEDALMQTHGNRTQAAELLGLSRQGLLNKMKKFGIE